MIVFMPVQVTWIAILAFAVVSCSQNVVSERTPYARGKKFPGGVEVQTTTGQDGGIRATLDPNSTSAQLININSGALSGMAVSFPVGSLTIPMTVTISPGASLSGGTLLGNLGVSGNAVTNSGTPVEISASANVDLRNPMVLALPIPTGTGLTGTAVDRSRLAVIYRIKKAEGTDADSYTGMAPATGMGFENNRVLFPSKYFGWFSVVALQEPAPPAVEVRAKYADQLGAKWFATVADLPACTTADVSRIAYVASDNLLYYCTASGTWSATSFGNTTSTSQPVRVVRVSDGSEIARVVSASSLWRLLVKGSSGNAYLLQVYLDSADPTTGIAASDILVPYLNSGAKPSTPVYFTAAGCQGSTYSNVTPAVKWARAPIYLNDTLGDFAYEGWYDYTSYIQSTNVAVESYFDSYANPSCVDYSQSLTLYPVQKMTETLPIPYSGAWQVK